MENALEKSQKLEKDYDEANKEKSRKIVPFKQQKNGTETITTIFLASNDFEHHEFFRLDCKKLGKCWENNERI